MEMVKKKVALLGATGSIGKSTLQVIREQSDKLELTLATAHCNCDDLFKTADEFKIKTIVVTNENLKPPEPHCCPEFNIYYGEDELIRILKDGDYDIVLNAISGSAGLRSTMAVLETGKNLALANKESLVMAGHLVKELQSKHGSKILPVDSEHSALFQAIGQHPLSEVAKVHITASGGAFRTIPLEDFSKITVEQALRHPNWDMGFKVTLDSATMFNKALEVIEAHWLFNLRWEQIKAVIHPQSVIHSMVEFMDGSLLAQMSVPDMKLPILYALSYPERFASKLVQTNVTGLPNLTFESISPERYPLFYLGVEAGKQGGIFPTVANSANEAALQLFLQKKIGFIDIYRKVQKALDETENVQNPDLNAILEVNAEVYNRLLNGD
jgi:1-deoxy-D-xylulose-5-phosphate reductoisomerase